MLCRCAWLVVVFCAGVRSEAQFAGPFPIPVTGTRSSLPHYSGYMQMRATERGMPLNVNAMAFDRNRTLWLALDDGLLRCDGDRHTLYQHSRKDSTSLPNNAVSDVRVAPDGAIWVGTQSGLARLDPRSGRFARHYLRSDSLSTVPANRFWQVTPLTNGSVIAQNEIGLAILSPDGAFRFVRDGGALGQARNVDFQLLVERDGSGAWAAASGGIHRIDSDGNVKELRADGLFNGLVIERPLCLTWTAEGGLLWVDFTRERIVEADLATGRWREEELPKRIAEDRQPRALAKDGAGAYWLATWTNNLYTISNERSAVLQLFPSGGTALGSPGQFVPRSFMIDDEARLWIATSHGALALLPVDPRVRRIPLSGLSQEQPLISLQSLADGRLLAGSYRGGLIALKHSGGEALHCRQASPRRGKQYIDGENTITAAVPIGPRRVLAATYHGLHEIDIGECRFIHRGDLEALLPDLTRRNFTDLVADTNGWFWAASWMHGLYRFHPERGLLKRYTHIPGDPNSLPIDRLLRLLIDEEGTLWIGANDGGGLCRYRRGTDDFERIGLATADGAGAALGVVRALARDADGAIWIGTHKGGVARYEPAIGRTTVFDQTQGVPGDLIRALASDKALGTWVGGRGGLAKWNAAQQVFQRIDFGVEWSDEVAAIVPLPEEVALLVLNGSEVVRIDLGAAGPPARAPLPLLLALRVNGEPIAPSAPPRFTRGRERISVEFALTDPIRAQRTRMAWRLVGLSDEWTDCLGCRNASFGELPAGDFIFEARVLDEQGHWTEPQQLAAFTVAPPWWATWWFMLVALLAAMGSVLLGARLYVTARLRRQREAFEREQALLAERMRIADDMHDDLGAGLSGLKLRSEMALRVEQDPLRRAQLETMAQGAGELITSMRQIIWAMSSDQGTAADLAAYSGSYARNYCAQHGLSLEVLTEEHWPTVALTSEQRRNCFLVIKEALHNVVKHAQAERVRLRLAWSDGLSITIEDDGLGLPKHAQEGSGNGLRSMQRRMTTIGGRIEQRNGRAANGELTGALIALHLPLHP